MQHLAPCAVCCCGLVGLPSLRATRCPDCEHRLFRSSGAASVKCPKPTCLKYLTRASLSLKSPEELEYEKEITVRGDLEKV